MKSLFFIVIILIPSSAFSQSQSRKDFYGIKLSLVNKPEMQRDLEISWYDRVKVDPVDEQSRYLLHIVEELEARRLHLNEVFDFIFVKNGDLPGFVHNRIKYNLKDKHLETPRTYEALEGLRDFILYDVDVDLWRRSCEAIQKVWDNIDNQKRYEFVVNLMIDGEDYFYYYDEISVVEVDGETKTLEELGYKSYPKPKFPPKPKLPKTKYGFKL